MFQPNMDHVDNCQYVYFINNVPTNGPATSDRIV